MLFWVKFSQKCNLNPIPPPPTPTLTPYKKAQESSDIDGFMVLSIVTLVRKNKFSEKEGVDLVGERGWEGNVMCGCSFLYVLSIRPINILLHD